MEISWSRSARDGESGESGDGAVEMTFTATTPVGDAALRMTEKPPLAITGPSM